MSQEIANISPEVMQAKLRLGIVGNTPSLLEAVQRAIKVSPIDLSVLITGESGSGKEFFPQIIHQYSPRKHSKYIAVNCGAIPEGTIDSELFGHEKGSFTGAVATRKGYFEEADGGTIFLDEVAELPLTTQARLLRVLETGEFLKVGSSTVQKTNIRVVAATNVDMAKAVVNGRFREDLYYRLSTVQISVPPLRSRGNDIMLLAKKFATDFAEKYRTPEISFTQEAATALLRYSWPGNVRQLKNVVEQAALFQAGEALTAQTLSSYLPAIAPGMSAEGCQPAIRSNSYDREREMLFNFIFRLQAEISELRSKIDAMGTSAIEKPISTSLMKVDHSSLNGHHKHDERQHEQQSIIDVDASEMETTGTEVPPTTLEDTERKAIIQSLQRHEGRRKAAAKELKISERTLYRKIKEYGLE